MERCYVVSREMCFISDVPKAQMTIRLFEKP